MHGFEITRQIGIDAGHRVYTHGSKCRNLHGHRYEIFATCSAPRLQQEGVQQDMIIDFGFLKEEMMEVIDKVCDHALILSADDPEIRSFAPPSALVWLAQCSELHKYWLGTGDRGAGKLVVVPFIPTAERLAEWWFMLLQQRIIARGGPKGTVTLERVQVYETPNCSAVYPA